MITVWGTGRGFRVVWLLEEMGLPYRVRQVDLLAGVENDSEFLAINPSGFIPALQDGDTIMVESIEPDPACVTQNQVPGTGESPLLETVIVPLSIYASVASFKEHGEVCVHTRSDREGAKWNGEHAGPPGFHRHGIAGGYFVQNLKGLR